MKYGMNILLWTMDGTTDEAAPLYDLIKRIGYDTVEIPLFAADAKKAAALGKRLDGVGLERTAVTVLSPETNTVSPDAKVRRAGVDHLKAILDDCKALNAKFLVGPFYAALGAFSGTGPTAQELGWAAEALREVAEHAKGAGVTLGIEFLNRFEIYLLNCAADAAKLVDTVNHPNCKMMYDTFHSHIEEKDTARAIEAGGKRIAHVHISENDRGTPGSGNVNWKATFATLKRIGYTGPLVVEAFGQKLEALAAATKIWRRMYQTEEQLTTDALKFMKENWEAA